MYVGMTTIFIGGGFLLDTWWAFILLPLVVLLIDRQVIAREERYLASAFGAEYDDISFRGQTLGVTTSPQVRRPETAVLRPSSSSHHPAWSIS